MTIQNEKVSKLVLPTPFPVGDVNVYLIQGDRLTLIDAGPKTSEAKEALESQLKELGYCLSDIDQVILTHHHSDHCGLIDLFGEDLPLLGHEDNQRMIVRDSQFLELQSEFFKEMAKKFGIPEEYMVQANRLTSIFKYSGSKPLTHFLKEGDYLPGHPDWRVIETFGHSAGHLSFMNEKTGVLIGGDLLLGRISPNPILEPPKCMDEPRAKPQLQLNDSLRRISKEELTEVLPGHGEAITDPYALIEKRLAMQKDRAFHVKKLIGEEKLTVLEICTRLFPKVFMKEPALTLFETLGQLDYLEDLQEIKTVQNDGVVLYQVI